MTSAVSQGHVAPAQHRDLIVSLADFECFALRVHAVALVDVVDAVGKPHAAVAIVSLDSVDCFPCGLALYALGGNLPAGFVGDGLAVFKGQAVVVSELFNRADVNHFCISLLFPSGIIIAHSARNVNKNFSILPGFCVVFLYKEHA